MFEEDQLCSTCVAWLVYDIGGEDRDSILILKPALRVLNECTPTAVDRNHI